MSADWAAIAAWIAAIVAVMSAAYTWWSRWWNRPSVHWICDGTAQKPMRNDAQEPRIRIALQLVNCGDAPAFGVETVRCNGESYRPFTVFEAGVVPPGGTIEVNLTVAQNDWSTCWVEPRYRSSPTARSPLMQGPGRFLVSQVLADPDRLPPGYNPGSRGSGPRIPEELRLELD